MGVFPAATPARLWSKGALLHVTNPKAILGWIAIMSLGVRPDASPPTMLMIVAGCAILGLAVNVGYATVFSTALMGRAWGKSRRWIEGALAGFFGFAGLRILLSQP